MSNSSAKKGGNYSQLDRDEVIRELIKVKGNVMQAAKNMDLPRSTLSGYIQADDSLVELLNECRQEIVDNAETALHRAVLTGEAWAVCFTLKTQGKNRGYIEREKDPRIPDLEAFLNELPRSLSNAIREAAKKEQSEITE